MNVKGKEPSGPDVALLSPAQERLWVLEQLAPGDRVYQISKAFRITGTLQPDILEQSLSEIVRRHEALRTTFRAESGRPVRVVWVPTSFHLPVVELQDMPASEREQEVRRLAVEQARTRFDLTRDLMMRATLARVEKTEHVLMLTLHQLAADAESIGIILQELAALYEASVARQRSPLADVASHYPDLVAEQREWLKSEAAREQLEFWKERLAGAPALLDFPMSRPRPASRTRRGGSSPVVLDREMAKALHALSEKEQCSLSATVLAAFQALVSRYTGRTDIVVGWRTSHRSRASEGVVGNFSNTLVHRVDLSGDPEFAEVLRRVGAALAEARAHGEFPFAKLVEELNPPRHQSYHAIVQAGFIFQEQPFAMPQAGTLAITELEIDYQTAELDVSLALTKTERGMEGWIEYATDLFEADVIARMRGHLERMLAGIVENPRQPLSRLPLLSDPERTQLLFEWNDTGSDSPPGECLHHLFEAQVQARPEAVALEFEGERLTYGELNRRANRLAGRLQQLGVGPEVLVGICVRRSVEMIAGILAVLKAGGAYVPMDPAYPSDRLAYILQDAKTPVLLTQKDLGAGVPEFDGAKVFLDEPDLWADGPDGGHPTRGVQPQNLAYVIYTSGSTGRPKGVAIEHQSAVKLAQWAQEVFSPEELAGVLASTSICFDLSVFEMFVPLSAGGKIILAENVLQLPKLSAASQVTLVNTVPSAITELVRAGVIPRSARTICLAGEPLDAGLVRRIYQQGSVAKVYDLYGPTEATVYATFALRRSDGPTTIGRPISNTRVYLLDEHLQPVPVGVPGELHIGGAGLARGYLNQPSLTSEKFIASPFEEKPGRLYKTGDLARYRPDGNIEFLGRKDYQVKIRGFRIELGEIESVLRQHSSVEAAVIVAGEDAQGEKRLLAYYQASSAPIAPATLREWLRSKLPEYMVPALLIPLPALPLTPNGKIDRKALPPPEQILPSLTESFVEPRTSAEMVLAEVWREVLGVEKVGVHDNFFELGGHSLKSIQVISRLREDIQVELSMRDFFEMPTISALAERVEAVLVREVGDLTEEEAESKARSVCLSES